MTQLAVAGLDKRFGAHQVLAGLDLDVPAGSLTAILGPSGSGKTTLLRILAGFEHADAGTVRIGSAVADGPGVFLPPERRRIGYVPQEGSLFPHLTVAANVAFGLSRRKVGRARRGQRSAELLEAVGLAGLDRRYPHQLSGGQQQRVALARALAIAPEVVLLDEPFASLDAHLRASVRADVQRLLKESGTTTVLVTHDQDEALSTADRVAVLRDGGIAQCAAPQELYCRPVDAEMARFIGEANLIPGVLHGSSVQTLLGVLAVTGADPADPAGAAGAAGAAATANGNGAGRSPAMVLIRPEQVELVPGSPGPARAADGGEDGLTGRIIGYGYHGHDAVVTVQPERDPQAPPLTVRTLGGQALSPGSRVTLRARGPVIAWPQRD
ncbi:MAG TPA: ABC transporter ATP-binding protein [Streptosporangiaceae bacterium]|jgi:iron(III) transport system ATP-binding protein